ncbi:acetyl-coenzyme A carboxylase carboxyl transferase subunit alpha, chloroplastic-like [Chenopodium quinoa]|uniref:acetyl-coenzyme A carboxylase carboxyl transferase subunit alpha, chloroplastic-like n=1 Tax=Chenopodium quinoa TaxID=63459 RepID=UPI000B784D56|nr:acetyl-coenzyme A carboxylase carboxyl transferase subunit alpha, chloroplastic-like [Chenopodium quinoa]
MEIGGGDGSGGVWQLKVMINLIGKGMIFGGNVLLRLYKEASIAYIEASIANIKQISTCEGDRKLKYADHHGFLVITLIDTPRAYADLKSKELGQGEAIAQNIRSMFGLRVPVISIVTGEGGFGGALAICCCNKLFMLENPAFYVASMRCNIMEICPSNPKGI